MTEISTYTCFNLVDIFFKLEDDIFLECACITGKVHDGLGLKASDSSYELR